MRRLVLLALVLPACAKQPPRTGPTIPSGVHPPELIEAPSLPPVPLVEGPLAIRVQYPAANALIQSRDSNFIFGTVGNGKATLTINGASVPVLPNGAWLAWLPVPPSESPQYQLVAALGADTVRLTHIVRVLPPRKVLPLDGPLVVDSASVSPRGALGLRDDELVRVSVRAPANASVFVRADSTRRFPLVRDAETWSTDVPASAMRSVTRLVVARGGDTVRFTLPVVSTPTPRLLASLGADSAAASDTDRVIIGRPTPGGTYKWFLLPGTRVEVIGWRDEWLRVRLDANLDIWVASSDARILPAGTSLPARVARNVRLVPDEQWVDVVIPIGERPAYAVEEGERSIDLVLYGTRSDTDILRYVHDDTLIRVATWAQETSDRVRYRFELSQRPYGYLAMWRGDAFVLRVRRAPRLDRRHPLRGLTIAVDAGHPPAGSTGPTGLYEAVPTLAVAGIVKELLEERGATVVMTRTTPEPLELGLRPIIARQANAHALVSIHLDALPDGVNPFEAHGTATYFFHPQAEPMARALQRALVSRMGLRNNGINYDNLALARPTWMPAVLTEGAFIMIPEQEAALRTPEFQRAYARGVADGLEDFFRTLAEEQREER